MNRTRTWLFISIGLIIVVIGLAVGLVFALMNYFDQKDNVDSKVSVAVASAVKTQADKDAAQFEAEEKKPTREFVGPEDYGELRFQYPKTWSVYVAKDASQSGDFQAYLNPVSVPAVSSTQQYALRVSIETRGYDQVLDTYQSLVKTGALKSSAVKVNGQDGTRLDGNFSKDIRGSAVIFKIRDKTVTLRSDATTFEPDFNALISTVSFNV